MINHFWKIIKIFDQHSHAYISSKHAYSAQLHSQIGVTITAKVTLSPMIDMILVWAQGYKTCWHQSQCPTAVFRLSPIGNNMGPEWKTQLSTEIEGFIT